MHYKRLSHKLRFIDYGFKSEDKRVHYYNTAPIYQLQIIDNIIYDDAEVIAIYNNNHWELEFDSKALANYKGNISSDINVTAIDIEVEVDDYYIDEVPAE